MSIKRCSFTAKFVIFRVLKFPQGKGTYNKQVRCYIKPSFHGILLSNICTKHYWNLTTIVEIIVGGWVVSFSETQCMWHFTQFCMRHHYQHTAVRTAHVAL